MILGSILVGLAYFVALYMVVAAGRAAQAAEEAAQDCRDELCSAAHADDDTQDALTLEFDALNARLDILQKTIDAQAAAPRKRARKGDAVTQ